MKFFPGVHRLDQTAYSDKRDPIKSDPERERQPELDWYMERYEDWRAFFDGRALEETLSTTGDLATDVAQEAFRWPVRLNLIRAYCLLFAGLLWGRARTGMKSDDLFDIRIDPKIPGRPGPESKSQAKQLTEYLSHWWYFFFHTLRPSGTIQQWAGGCALKVAWNPFSPSSVYGTQLQIVQPEHFFPIWNPLNFEELFAVKIKFTVSRLVAAESYGLTKQELEDLGVSENDKVGVEEHWDRREYYVVVGKGHGGKNQSGIIARSRGLNGETIPLKGENPFIHPVTHLGIIPFVYVPRLRVGGFFGDSLAYSLEGVQNEVNKTLADFGDALTRGTHPALGISDFHGAADKKGGILLPRHGALNLGKTPPGRTPPKVHNFPLPEVPDQTGPFLDTLLKLSEVITALTPAAKGSTVAAKSGFAMALEMLPTTNTVDWERSHWNVAITGKGGINEILATIWYNKGKELEGLPQIPLTAFQLRQEIEFRPVVPRDRIEVIDEVTRLVTAKAISPQEWLKRLGDIEDLDTEYQQLADWLVWYAGVEAAVAGRAIEITESENPETPAEALPTVSGKTLETAQRQPAKEPEGQEPNRAQSQENKRI